MSDGNRILELRADLAESYQAEGVFILKGVTFTQFDRGTAKASARGQADSAIFHTETEDAELSGHILLASVGEDASVEAESLDWDGATKVLKGGLDRTVRVRKGDGTWVRGAGFISDTRTRSFTFREAVEGKLVVKDEAPDEAAP
jgi:LPS export ABC transporter protein LptC